MSVDPRKHATMFTLVEDPVDRTLAVVNRFLMVGVLALFTYILWTPFFGEVIATYRKATDKTQGYVYQSKLLQHKIAERSVQIDTPQAVLKPIPTVNTLVIPSINVDASVLEGQGATVLNQGFWRRPKTSTPDKGGNTVITGHRFLYTSGPNTFYNLDKVKIGDDIIVYWEGKEYDYIVEDRQIVTPQDTQIEDPTDSSILTLYTCTPLWTSKQRLVVRARLAQ